jgi:thiol-disulfide isomerase/thioredoxin
VLNFWGSWCSVCQQEAPALAAAARQFARSGVRFVGVDVADDAASVVAPDGRIAGRIIGAAHSRNLRRLIKAAL